MHIHQVVDYPEIEVNVDRDKAGQVGLTQRDVSQQPADFAELAAARWRPPSGSNWRNGVSYNVAVQTPQYRMNSSTR